MLYQSNHPWTYRRSPVPRTGKSRHFRGSYFRHPKTTQERRYALDPEHKKYMRKGRSFRTLPNSYDDVSKTYHKNWKRYRKTRYWKIIDM